MLESQSSNSSEIVLSVIVIARNEEAFVSDCLNSILDQRATSTELIVVDDCSSDSTKDILNEKKSDCPHLRVAHNSKNMGPGLSRNIGIKMAKGKYLMFVDGDDTLVDKCLAKILCQIDHESPDILTFNHNLLYDNGLVLAARQTEILENASSLKGDEQKNCLLRLYQIACNKVYRLDYIKLHALYFSNGNYEDTAYAYKTILLADTISASTETYYNYRQRPGTAPYRPNKKEDRVNQHFLVQRYREIFEFLSENDLQHFACVIYSKMLIQFNAVIGERYDRKDRILFNSMKEALVEYRPEQIKFPTFRGRIAYWCIRFDMVGALVTMNRLYSIYYRYRYSYEASGRL